MQFLSSRVLVMGMLFAFAVPQQVSASSVNLVQLGGTAVCVVGGGTGGEDICTGAVSDTLTFAITMEIDGAGANAWSLDLGWDRALENALDLTSALATEFYSRGFANPTPPPASIGYTALAIIATQESDATQDGFVHNASGAITQDFNLTISNTSFRAGTATFSISATDQTVLELGFFRTDGASMGNSASQFITPTFGSWVINQAPEPGTTLLMGLGLFGLALAARRSRR